jgi:hypothetical protein
LGRWTKRDPIGEEGGINIYISLNNNLISSFDHLGNSTGCCGPDITKPFLRLLKRVESFWTKLSSKDKDKRYEIFSFKIDPETNERVYKNAWDILQLAKWWTDKQIEEAGSSWLSSGDYKGCAMGTGCEDTVQVFTHCYYIGSVNYALFGKIMQVTGQSKFKMNLLISLYKGELSGKQAPNYEMSRKWAEFGYDQGRTVPPAEKTRSHCKSCGKACADDMEFKFYWYPYTPSDGLYGF